MQRCFMVVCSLPSLCCGVATNPSRLFDFNRLEDGIVGAACLQGDCNVTILIGRDVVDADVGGDACASGRGRRIPGFRGPTAR